MGADCFLLSDMHLLHAVCGYVSRITMADMSSLRKHAYSNILKISPPKTLKFSDKNSDIFHISAQNIDCGYT